MPWTRPAPQGSHGYLAAKPGEMERHGTCVAGGSLWKLGKMHGNRTVSVVGIEVEFGRTADEQDDKGDDVDGPGEGEGDGDGDGERDTRTRDGWRDGASEPIEGGPENRKTTDEETGKKEYSQTEEGKDEEPTN